MSGAARRPTAGDRREGPEGPGGGRLPARGGLLLLGGVGLEAPVRPLTFSFQGVILPHPGWQQG